MAGKPIFSDEQHEVTHAAVLRVWKRFKAEKKTQEDLALALGVSQQTVSALLKGEYRPGYRPAQAIANLDGKRLEQLLEGVAGPVPLPSEVSRVASSDRHTFANLDVCIQFHAATKHWSPWTIAAARAGYFGNADFAPPEWAGKLDALERALERAKKGT